MSSVRAIVRAVNANESTSGARLRRIALVSVLTLLLVAPGAWWLAHSVLSHPGAAPFAGTPMPTLPPADDNGFDEVVQRRVNAPDIPDSVKPLTLPLDTETPSARLHEVTASLADVRAAVAEPRDAAALDRLFGAPRFADTCTRPEDDCRTTAVLGWVRFAMLLDLAQALDGDLDAASARAVHLLRASLDLLRTARFFVALAVGVHVVRAVLDHVRVLEAAATARGLPLPGAAGLVPLLEGVHREDFDVRRAIVSESTWVRALLAERRRFRATGHSASPYTPLFREVPPLPVDEGATCAASDAYFLALMRWAERSDRARRAPPAPPRYTERAFWWVWNPGGKRMLDALSLDLGHQIKGLDSSIAALFASRDTLVRALRAGASP